MARLYSNLKFLAFPDHLRALRKNQPIGPVHVRVKPINRCNHSCWYCAYRADNLQLGADMEINDRMPPAKLFEMIDDFIELGVAAVTFSGGGEPLLYKELPDAIERLARGGIKTAALTNGGNLKGAMADAFAAHGTWIRVSLDAWDDDSYSRSRGVGKGAFTALLNNMRAFAARRSSCVLGVSLIVSHDNAPHVEEICTLLKETGVNHVKISGAVISNTVTENNAYHQVIADDVRKAIDAISYLNNDDFMIIDHYHEMEDLFIKDYKSCEISRLLTVVGADCEVYTCQDKAYTESGRLGSIANQRFKDFWLSAEAQARLAAVDPSRICRHHCVAHHKNLALQEFLSLDPNHLCFV